VNETQRYILGEHIEDFEDGLITRRELLRRAGVIMGGASAGLAALVALGCNLERPASASSPATSPSPSTAASSPAVAYATPPASPTTDGVTVKPNDPRIAVEPSPIIKASDGAGLIAYLAHPAAAGRHPAILVIHENRGLTEHIRDVIRRVATAGFTGVGIDLVSRDGGADKLTDAAAYQAALGKRSVAEMVKDEQSAIEYIKGFSFTEASQVGVVGFCFGGGLTWSVLAAGTAVQAAAPFYGPMPQDSAGLAKTKAAVSAVYAEKDTRITGTKDQMEALLKQAGVPYQLTVYPGVDHAFHNDTGNRYDAAQAQKAWVATIDWFKKYLGGTR
jgi:carboxymethylenebutenolidase